MEINNKEEFQYITRFKNKNSSNSAVKKKKLVDLPSFYIKGCPNTMIDAVIECIELYIVSNNVSENIKLIVKEDQFSVDSDASSIIHVNIRDDTKRRDVMEYIENHVNKMYDLRMSCKERGEDIVVYGLMLPTSERPDVRELRPIFDKYGKNDVCIANDFTTFINFRDFKDACDANNSIAKDAIKIGGMVSYPSPVQHTRMLINLEYELKKDEESFYFHQLVSLQYVKDFVATYSHDTFDKRVKVCVKFIEKFFGWTLRNEILVITNMTFSTAKSCEIEHEHVKQAMQNSALETSSTDSSLRHLHREYLQNSLKGEKAAIPELQVETPVPSLQGSTVQVSLHCPINVNSVTNIDISASDVTADTKNDITTTTSTMCSKEVSSVVSSNKTKTETPAPSNPEVPLRMKMSDKFKSDNSKKTTPEIKLVAVATTPQLQVSEPVPVVPYTCVREMFEKVLQKLEQKVFGGVYNGTTATPQARLESMELYMMLPTTDTNVSERIKNIEASIEMMINIGRNSS